MSRVTTIWMAFERGSRGARHTNERKMSRLHQQGLVQASTRKPGNHRMNSPCHVVLLKVFSSEPASVCHRVNADSTVFIFLAVSFPDLQTRKTWNTHVDTAWHTNSTFDALLIDYGFGYILFLSPRICVGKRHKNKFTRRKQASFPFYLRKTQGQRTWKCFKVIMKRTALFVVPYFQKNWSCFSPYSFFWIFHNPNKRGLQQQPQLADKPAVQSLSNWISAKKGLSWRNSFWCRMWPTTLYTHWQLQHTNWPRRKV